MKKLCTVAVSFSVVGFVCFMAGAVWSGGLTVEAEGDGQGGAVPISGDVNADGRLDVSDGIYILNYVFRAGPLPVAIECPPARLPATGQTACFDDTSTDIDCATTDFPGQDAFYQAGCPSEDRFIDNLDGTVTDNCAGLMWQRDTADVSGNGSIGNEDPLAWQDALKYCESLSFAGHDDWRLPNVRELQSIVDYARHSPSIDPVFGAVPAYHWSSTTVNLTVNAWYVQFSNGDVNSVVKTFAFYVRAVRGGL